MMNLNILKTIIATALILTVLMAGCSKKIVNDCDESVKVLFKSSLASIGSAAQFTGFELTVYCPDLDSTIETTLNYEDGFIVGEVEVPVGDDRVFTLYVYDDNHIPPLIYEGTVTRDIGATGVMEIVIPMYPQVPTIKITPRVLGVPQWMRFEVDIKIYNIPDVSSFTFEILQDSNYITGLHSFFTDTSNKRVTPLDFEIFTFVVTSKDLATAFVDDSGYSHLGKFVFNTCIECDPGTTILTINPLYAYDSEQNLIPLDNIYTNETQVSHYDLFYEKTMGYWQMEIYSFDPIVPIEDHPYYGNGLDGSGYNTGLGEWNYSYSRTFNGINSYIEIPDHDSLDITDELTIAMFLKIDTSESLESTILGKGTLNGDINYSLKYSQQDGEHLKFVYGSTTKHEYSVPVSLLSSSWYEYIMFSIRFGEPESAAFVINGQFIEGEWIAGNGTGIPLANDGNLQMGRELLGTDGSYLTGKLDEVRIFHTYMEPSYLIQYSWWQIPSK